jgi:hypothetical protein
VPPQPLDLALQRRDLPRLGLHRCCDQAGEAVEIDAVAPGGHRDVGRAVVDDEAEARVSVGRAAPGLQPVGRQPQLKSFPTNSPGRSVRRGPGGEVLRQRVKIVRSGAMDGTFCGERGLACRRRDKGKLPRRVATVLLSTGVETVG